MEKEYPLIIIGAGPAGLSASIYASRYGIKHLVIGSLVGGQISGTHLIDNYPGIEDASGFEFSQKFANHAKKYGVEVLAKTIKNIQKNNTLFALEMEGGEKISAKTIILATGTKHRKLNIPGEAELIGKGVSYCATCDGFFYKNKIVAVVGGNDSAAGAAVYLADIAEKVYLIYRKDKLRAEPYWVTLVEKNKKIEVVYNTNITKILGANKTMPASRQVEKVILDNNKKELLINGLFIEAGSEPNFDFAKNLNIASDEQGYIKIKSDTSTSVEGVWAAGDITDGSDKFRQVITAAAEGAIAARSVYNFLKK